ncbi:MAG: AsmA family protein [Desulfobacteraceae bacterium]
MNRTIKWIVSIIGVFVLLVLIAIVIVSLVVDVEKYKPLIETKVSEATGRSFTLGGPLEPSLFPWVGLQLSDLHLANPSGFEEKDFLSVKSFEVRVKLLPLMLRKIEVKRFVMDAPRIVLEKAKDGSAGWQGLGSQKSQPPPDTKSSPAPPPSGDGGLPIESLVVGELAITNGQILYLDKSTDTRKEVNDIRLVLSDVSFDKSIGVEFSAVADNNPLSLNGTLGPLGDNPGKTPLPLDMLLSLAQHLNIKLSGVIDPSGGTPNFDLAMEIAPFSPRKLLENLQQPLPMEPADSAVLNALSFSLKADGSARNVSISQGRMTLDDTRIEFSAQAKEFDKPNLTVKMDLDRIDLDRYLPAAKDEKEPSPEPSSPSETQPTDYSPLRKLVMDARFQIGELKVKNIQIRNMAMTATAKNGIIAMNPLKLDLYQGNITGTSTLDVQQDTPRTAVDISLAGIQSGPLIKDMLDKEMIEGAMTAAVGLKFKGDQPGQIRQTLNGQGSLKFNDGAIVGIDLAGMVRNVQTAFGVGAKPAQKPRTDFAELVLPFTITQGLFKTDNTKMTSPLLRVQAAGTADLPSEAIDMRIVPKFVATIKGQGDTEKRSGLAVPVLVSGNFSKPKFTPDLKALLNQKIGQPLPDKEALKKLVPTEESVKKKVEDKAKELLKGLPFGNN